MNVADVIVVITSHHKKQPALLNESARVANSAPSEKRYIHVYAIMHAYMHCTLSAGSFSPCPLRRILRGLAFGRKELISYHCGVFFLMREFPRMVRRRIYYALRIRQNASKRSKLSGLNPYYRISDLSLYLKLYFHAGKPRNHQVS